MSPSKAWWCSFHDHDAREKHQWMDNDGPDLDDG
jgi:hypothetical protein